MKQYLTLASQILQNGSKKPAAREGMPGSTSLFGPQIEFDLSKGFPIMTTKNIPFRWIVAELAWFLTGDTNVFYLNKVGVDIWNEDAYNYYKKLMNGFEESVRSRYSKFYRKCETTGLYLTFTFEEFVEQLNKANYSTELPEVFLGTKKYRFGECGHQYGKTWRNLQATTSSKQVDQMEKLIKDLRTNPESRRHVVSSIDPYHSEDLALYWCHSMFQFNCDPLTVEERVKWLNERGFDIRFSDEMSDQDRHTIIDGDELKVPKYRLDCKMYQRSADMFLGVPFNISSYALLTHIVAKMCNMIPGRYIHTFGDAHIYDNHVEQINEQLSRERFKLPTIDLDQYQFEFGNDWTNVSIGVIGESLKKWLPEFSKAVLIDYKSHKAIKGKLSTGVR